MNQKQKIRIAKEWANKFLNDEEQGDFWLCTEDIIVIKEALNLWLSDHKEIRDIKFFVNGIEHELTPMEEE